MELLDTQDAKCASSTIHGKKQLIREPGRVDLDVAQLSWASSLTAECFFPFTFFSVGSRLRCTPNPKNGQTQESVMQSRMIMLCGSRH